MEKWSMCERVVFEQTVFDKIKDAVKKIDETGRKTDSKDTYSFDYRNYTAPKLRKVHLGGVVLRPPAPKMQISSLGIHPAYEYDIPRFALEWIERKDETHLIVDLHPTRDTVLSPDYVKKYLAPLHPILNKALETPGTSIERRIPTPTNYWLSTQYSMYTLRGGYAFEYTEKAWEFALKYLDVWLECWKKAEPTTDPEDKKIIQKRLEMMSEAYRTLDPGARFWMRIGGEKLAKEMQGFSW